MKWKVLHILAEGDAEYNFARQVIVPHLYSYSVDTKVQKASMKKNQRKADKGGVVNYEHVKRDLLHLMSGDASHRFFTTMLDLYHMPSSFPNYAEASKVLAQGNTLEAVTLLEDGVIQDLKSQGMSKLHRLLPYFQVHEFEALLFSDLDMVFKHVGRFNEENKQYLQKVLSNADDNPESINHETGPALHFQHCFGNQKFKAQTGPLIAEEIGLAKIRSRCCFFDRWLRKLESLSEGN